MTAVSVYMYVLQHRVTYNTFCTVCNNWIPDVARLLDANLGRRVGEAWQCRHGTLLSPCRPGQSSVSELPRCHWWHVFAAKRWKTGSVCVCTHACVYVYAWMCVWVHTYVYQWICESVDVCIFLCVFMQHSKLSIPTDMLKYHSPQCKCSAQHSQLHWGRQCG